ncbi:MAG: hypothetical protein HKN20_02195 [Gemmatimonadetes bacterium]|nr:hypothetical protein [Gemmatimonadota bacterium]
MGLLIDTHYHLYPSHRAGVAVRSLLANLDTIRRTGPGTENDTEDDLAAILLAIDATDPLAALLKNRDSLHREGITLESDSARGMLTCARDGITATLFPGRQFLSTERIEVIALGEMPAPAAAAPLSHILASIEDAGCVAVVPWSPGRWTGKRGRIVNDALAKRERGGVLLGEIALRPAFAPATRVHRGAGKRGAPFLYGTDPLPARGDERMGGRFATRFPELDVASCTPSAVREEAARGRAFAAGSRNGFFEGAWRYARHFAGRAFGA